MSTSAGRRNSQPMSPSCFNGPVSDCLDRTVIQLFESTVLEHFDNVAVEHKGIRLTYSQLDSQANDLARQLVELGVGPNVRVAHCLLRSPAAIVATLAIMKSGGAFVPIDPGYPPNRVAFMLEDSATPVLITDTYTRPRLPRTTADTVYLEIGEEGPVIHAAGYPTPNVRLSDLAYIIYTSGSTGRPKGVQLTHRNLINSTLARLRCYSDPVERFLLLSPFAFDSSLAGIFWTLCQGGTLVLPGALEPSVLSMKDHEDISHSLCTPSFYHSFLLDMKTRPSKFLTHLVLAGEACQPGLVESHFNQFPHTRLFNEYGPTETCIWATGCEIVTREGDSSSPSIGHPIENTEICLYDENEIPSPIGEPGEVYIRGAGVGLGYWNSPQKTQECFLMRSPISSLKEARVFRTGDLAVARPDGSLVFLGRIDGQVKIRGLRVELGEVEAVLSEHPTVAAACVTHHEGSQGLFLVAYIVPQETAVDKDDLRAFLQTRLPDYMVPGLFLTLESLPLTSWGKVDRAALPPPDVGHSESKEQVDGPRSGIERQIVAVWLEVLQIDCVGIHDNFFELGGHSLSATRIIGRLRDMFAVDIGLAALFDTPTVAGLSEIVETGQQAGRRS